MAKEILTEQGVSPEVYDKIWRAGYVDGYNIGYQRGLQDGEQSGRSSKTKKRGW